jgi:oligopeptidase B
MTAKAPRAAKKPVTTTVHGIDLVDDYAWLRDPKWQDVMRDPSVLTPEIRTYLEAENAWTETTMAPTGGLQETLFGEMKGRIKEDDSSVPSPDGSLLLRRQIRHRRPAAPVHSHTTRRRQ